MRVGVCVKWFVSMMRVDERIVCREMILRVGDLSSVKRSNFTMDDEKIVIRMSSEEFDGILRFLYLKVRIKGLLTLLIE